MNLLFVENRYKTYFLDAIAENLKAYNIFWIVQNPQFMPQNGTIHKLPFPKASDLDNTEISEDYGVRKIIESDRQINFFNKSDHRYFFYYRHLIEKVIDEVKPDFVFGESTAFHELLTIDICKRKEITFLHPTSCRYPKNRFSFYENDTVEPYGGSNELLPFNEAIKIVNDIKNRVSKPNYMTKTKIDKAKVIKDKIKILKGYYMGEKYNTPSPFVKYNLENEKVKNIALWDEYAVKEIDASNFSVLYPLHLQPEANIDVWGREKRDQLKSITELSENLAVDQILYVKPNPKSKYELSKELISFCKETSNVKMIHHDVSMDAIFDKMDLYITVNGTIALECIFSNKPVITLVSVFFNRAKNCLYLKEFNSLQKFINDIKNNDFPVLDDEQKVDFLNLLNASSYDGIVSDPYYSEYCVSEENIKKISEAFINIISK